MNNCNNCGSCDSCKPACNKSYFNLQNDPYDPNYWLWEMDCENGRIRIPSLNSPCPSLTTDYSNATLNLSMGDCETQKVDGCTLGSLINLNCLRDVDANNPDACSLLVFNPGCGLCPCSPDEEMWKKYTIPRAEETGCEMEVDSDGYYKMLTLSDCGCIQECKMPAVPNGMTSLNYIRDSVPDDPDFPWYYGSYNDTINLHLADNAPEYFGKYALKVTVNYGVQTIVSDKCKNVNWTSRVVPVVNGEDVRMTQCASLLQGFSIYIAASLDSLMGTSREGIPWGSSSLRGSMVFIVPKGKEAYLHHEFRLRTNSSFPNYYTTPKDGQKVPDSEAGVDQVLYPASRLNQLQVIIEPTQGYTDYEPVTDAERDQLDSPVDVYPAIL